MQQSLMAHALSKLYHVFPVCRGYFEKYITPLKIGKKTSDEEDYVFAHVSHYEKHYL